MLDTISVDPSQAAQIPAPTAPEGADLLIRASPHDQSYWERHPQVRTYKVSIRAGEAQLSLWDVLVWLTPEAEPRRDAVPVNSAIPDRPADATFIVHATYDLGFFAVQPDVIAWRASLALNDDGPGAVHHIEVWMSSSALGR
jgi:hypothetical protein